LRQGEAAGEENVGSRCGAAKITLQEPSARIEVCARHANWALSAKMQEGNLNAAQKSEAAHIVGDATDAVTGKHWDEAGLSPDLVTIGRLDRLDQLLEAATKSSDGVTRNAQKLDLGLYDQVTANVRAQMGSLDAASNKEFDDIVAKYRARLTPEINLGP
jgi:hypothetical protein